MPQAYALAMQNFWPEAMEVRLRRGAASHATGFADPVVSLLTYSAGSTQKLFAATKNGIFDATLAGVAGAVEQAVTNGDFVSSHFTVPGGTYLIAVNGIDKLAMYDGSTWQLIDGGTTPAITGVTTSDLLSVTPFKQRLWFTQKGTMDAWYLPVAQIGGAAAKFSLGQLFTRGGSLMAVASWTVDGGAGLDDHLVFITTEGEIAVYTGTQPEGDDADFMLVGVYYIGRPLNKHCFVQYGGDIILLAENGVFPLSQALARQAQMARLTVSDAIDSAYMKAVEAYRNFPGWCGENFLTAGMLLINVPTGADGQATQLAMNTQTKAWTVFTGWNAQCWAVHKGELYFGSSSSVAKAWTGFNDFGEPITAYTRSAFTSLGRAGVKHIKLLRPVIKSTEAVRIGLGVDVDFESSDITLGPSALASAGALWDTDLWDEAVWAPDMQVQKNWRTVYCKEGYMISIRMLVMLKDTDFRWSSTDVMWQRGQGL